MTNDVSIMDVAKAAGVSKTTVSRVINGKLDRFRIGLATQERVRLIARQMGYQADPIARNIALGKGAPPRPVTPPAGLLDAKSQTTEQAKKTIGVVLSADSSTATMSLIPGIEPVLDAANYRLDIIIVPVDPTAFHERIARFLRDGHTGILCCPSVYPAVLSAVAGKCPVLVLWQGAGQAMLKSVGSEPLPVSREENKITESIAPNLKPIPASTPAPAPEKAVPPAASRPSQMEATVKPIPEPKPEPIVIPKPETVIAPAPVIPTPEQTAQDGSEGTPRPTQLQDAPPVEPVPVVAPETGPVSEPVVEETPDANLEPVFAEPAPVSPVPTPAPIPEPVVKPEPAPVSAENPPIIVEPIPEPETGFDESDNLAQNDQAAQDGSAGTPRPTQLQEAPPIEPVPVVAPETGPESIPVVEETPVANPEPVFTEPTPVSAVPTPEPMPEPVVTPEPTPVSAAEPEPVAATEPAVIVEPMAETKSGNDPEVQDGSAGTPRPTQSQEVPPIEPVAVVVPETGPEVIPVMEETPVINPEPAFAEPTPASPEPTPEPFPKPIVMPEPALVSAADPPIIVEPIPAEPVVAVAPTPPPQSEPVPVFVPTVEESPIATPDPVVVMEATPVLMSESEPETEQAPETTLGS